MTGRDPDDDRDNATALLWLLLACVSVPTVVVAVVALFLMN